MHPQVPCDCFSFCETELDALVALRDYSIVPFRKLFLSSVLSSGSQISIEWLPIRVHPRDEAKSLGKSSTVLCLALPFSHSVPLSAFQIHLHFSTSKGLRHKQDQATIIFSLACSSYSLCL